MSELNPEAAPRFISAKDLCRRWCISLATLYRHRAKGRVPNPVRIVDGGRVLWRLADIEAHEASLRA